MALVFLLDASGSVSTLNWQNQTVLTAEALENEVVAHTIDNMPDGVAAVAIAFADRAAVVVPWSHIRSKEERLAFSSKLKVATRDGVGYSTRLPHALSVAAATLQSIPCETDNKTIDISTDGIVEDIEQVERTRNALSAQRIRINALGFGSAANLEDFLRDSLKTENGFSMLASTWEEYAVAIRRKIIMEISWK